MDNNSSLMNGLKMILMMILTEVSLYNNPKIFQLLHLINFSKTRIIINKNYKTTSQATKNIPQRI